MKDGAKVRLFVGICKLLPDYLTISDWTFAFGLLIWQTERYIQCLQISSYTGAFLYDRFLHNA